jgi:ketosteroid isomerase-like protein
VHPHGNHDKTEADTIIAMEKRALDRWGRGDPSGFLEISSPDVVYFDPYLEKRIDGLQQLVLYYEGIRGKVRVDAFDLLNPKVQFSGDAAVLTFNYAAISAGATNRWNCTEVYARSGGDWRIVQSHWSMTNPFK